MALSGGTSFYRIGRQTAIGTKQTTLSDYVYEFSGGGIGMEADFAAPARNKGSFAPVAPAVGQVGTTGDLTIQQDATGIGLWLQYLFLANPVTTAVANVDIRSASAFTDGTAITIAAAMQPLTLLPSATNYIDGINATRLAFTFAGSTVGTGGGTITIVGFDQGGVNKRPLTEVITVPAGTITTATGTRFFSHITSVTTDGWSTEGTMAIAGQPNCNVHTHTMGNALLNGLTIEKVLGGTYPSTYIDCHIGEGTYNVGEVMEFQLSLLGGAAFPGENVSGGSTPTTLTGTSRPAGRPAADWGTIVQVNDTTYNVGTASCSVNHSLGTDEYPFNRDPFRPAPIIAGNREVTLSAQLNADDAANFIPFAWGDTISASISGASMDYGASNAFITLEMPNARLTRFPDARDVGQGQIAETLEMSGFLSGSDPDLRVQVVNSQTNAEYLA